MTYPLSGRPSSPVTVEAQRKRDAVQTFLQKKGLKAADLARLAKVSASSIGRTLSANPAKDTPSLQKLYKYISGTPDDHWGSALSALGSVTRGSSRHDASTAAQILRAVADLLDRVESAD